MKEENGKETEGGGEGKEAGNLESFDAELGELRTSSYHFIRYKKDLLSLTSNHNQKKEIESNKRGKMKIKEGGKSKPASEGGGWSLRRLR